MTFLVDVGIVAAVGTKPPQRLHPTLPRPSSRIVVKGTALARVHCSEERETCVFDSNPLASFGCIFRSRLSGVSAVAAMFLYTGRLARSNQGSSTLLAQS
jgi:hypothetical protein